MALTFLYPLPLLSTIPPSPPRTLGPFSASPNTLMKKNPRSSERDSPNNPPLSSGNDCQGDMELLSNASTLFPIKQNDCRTTQIRICYVLSKYVCLGRHSPRAFTVRHCIGQLTQLFARAPSLPELFPPPVFNFPGYVESDLAPEALKERYRSCPRE